MSKIDFKNSTIKEPRINNELLIYDKVRLVYKEHSNSESENDFNKVVTMSEALKLGKEYGLDLIEISSSAKPPVVKLYDYSKYLYELKRSMKQKTKKNSVCKEIRLLVNISQNDLEIKVRKAKEFINEGNKVKVVLTMKGRELTRREASKECFTKFIELMSDTAVFESMPRDEGNKVIAIFKRK